MEIYGKDYATGKPAEGFVEAIGDMEKTIPAQVLLDSSDDEDDFVSANDTQSVESSRSSKKMKREYTSSKRKRGKKEHESNTSSELASLKSSMKDMNAHLSTMANVMSRADEREQQEAEMKKKVLNDLLSLEGVTPTQALEVAQVLIAQPHKLILFSQCPDSLKDTYVKGLIGDT